MVTEGSEFLTEGGFLYMNKYLLFFTKLAETVGRFYYNMIISNIFNIYLFNINENYNSRLMFIHCWISEFIEQCKYKKKYVLIPPFSNLPFWLSCLFLKTFMYNVHSMYFQNNLIFRFRSESNFIIYSFLTGKLDFTFF